MLLFSDTSKSNTDTNDQFGWRVTISSDGNMLAVGAQAESSDAVGINGDQSNNNASQSGAVYVFSDAPTQGSPTE